MSRLASVAVFVPSRRWPVVVAVACDAGAEQIRAALTGLIAVAADAVVLPAATGVPCPFADPPNGPVTGPTRPGVLLTSAAPDAVARVWWLLDAEELAFCHRWQESRILRAVGGPTG